MVGRLFLAHAIVMGWGGIPVIWMGDEIATVNDPDWAAEPGHEDDNRWAHRPRMDWAARRAAPRPAARSRVGCSPGIRHLVAVARARCRTWSPPSPRRSPPLADPGVLPVLRRHPLGPLLELFNVTDSWRPFPGWRLAELGPDRRAGCAERQPRFIPAPDGNVWLHPYGVLWLTQSA